MLLWGDCLCPRDVAAVGSNQLCGMGVMRHNVLNWQWVIQRNRVQWTRFLCLENESKGLVFSPQKPSPMDSVSVHRNRVQRTRFLCIENESIGLVFYAQKPSPLDSISMHRNRVLWTRFLPTFFVREQLSSCRNRALFTRIARNQNSLKRFLTNDIVWVLLLFSKKNLTLPANYKIWFSVSLEFNGLCLVVQLSFKQVGRASLFNINSIEIWRQSLVVLCGAFGEREMLGALKGVKYLFYT